MSTKFIQLSPRDLCDLELLMNGSFNPVKEYMNKEDYLSCVKYMKLKNDKFWPMPITLSINEQKKKELQNEKEVILKDPTGLCLVKLILNKNSIYKYDINLECKHVLGTTHTNHPYVKVLKDRYNNGFIYYISGKLQKIIDIPHYDFTDLRKTPAEVKKIIKKNKWKKVVGFQTRNPMHRSHFELTKYALKIAGKDAKLLLNPVVGCTQPGDIDHFTRVKCYKKIMKYYKKNTAILSLLQLSMRMAGPREALFHALIRKNHGCTHFIIGRDHAGPSSKNEKGESFYGPYEAHQLALKHEKELGIKIILSQMIVYCENKKTKKGKYAVINKVNDKEWNINTISGTKFRHLLRINAEIPQWFSFKPIIDELKSSIVPYSKQGLCLYFVGLSGSGKSTLANSLMERLRELSTGKNFTLLDGDIVRNNLSKGLGFSKEDRKTNVRRIGWVASQIVKNNGICLVANIAPYKEDRIYNKNMIKSEGNYVQIWVNTTLKECKKRDVKGLYKLAEKGIIKNFTGVSDPFETPDESELIINGSLKIEKNINRIIQYITENNLYII